MSEYSYIKLNRFMLSHPEFSKISVVLSKLITNISYIFYPIFLILILIFNRQYIIKLTVVPLVSLIVVSILRNLINLERPYEKMDITPIIKKRTKGKSFPSRHTFAIFMIAFSVSIVNLWLGLIFTLFGCILAWLRVLLGLHYVRDVLAGFISAIILALLGYGII